MSVQTESLLLDEIRDAIDHPDCRIPWGQLIFAIHRHVADEMNHPWPDEPKKPDEDKLDSYKDFHMEKRNLYDSAGIRKYQRRGFAR